MNTFFYSCIAAVLIGISIYGLIDGIKQKTKPDNIKTSTVLSNQSNDQFHDARPMHRIDGLPLLEEKFHPSLNTQAYIEHTIQTTSSSSSTEDRLLAISRLGNIIRSGTASHQTQYIRSALRRLITDSNNPQIGRAAFFAYTRSFNSTESASEASYIIEAGLRQGFLSNEDYAGEHIHLGMLFDNKNLINTGLETGENYAKVILYNYLSAIPENSSMDIIDIDLKNYINNNPVKFTGAPFNFGLMESVQYNEWVMSKANIEFIINGTEKIDVLSQKFADPSADPRELLSLLIPSDTGLQIVEKIHKDPAYHDGIYKLNHFIKEYHHLESIGYISQRIDKRMQISSTK